MKNPGILLIDAGDDGEERRQERLQELGFRVVGRAASLEEAFSLTAELHPDVALLCGSFAMDADAAEALIDRHGLPSVLIRAGEDTISPRLREKGFPFSCLSPPFDGPELRVAIAAALFKLEAGAQLRRLDRLYSVLQEVDQVIVRATERHDLFERVCRILAEKGEFGLAWIAWSEPGSGVIRSVGGWGDEHGYLRDQEYPLPDDPVEQSPASAALREGRPAVNNDVRDGPRGIAWRDLALKAGFRAVAAFPVRVRGRVSGALALATSRAGVFLDREIQLLDAVAGEISFALDRIEEEAQRRQAEEALRVSEERYRSFIENFQGIAFRGRMDFTPFLFHGAVEQIAGYREEDFLAGTPRWEQVIHPEDRARLRKSFENVRMIPGYVERREYRIVRRDGAIRWLHEQIQTLGDESGRPSVVQGAIYDITDRKQAEQALRESERRFRVVFHQTFQHMALLEPDGRLIMANSTALASGGMQATEVAGKLLWETPWWSHSPEEQARIRRAVPQTAAGAIIRFETTQVSADGSILFVDLSLTPVRDEQGSVILIICEGRDITQRKRAEKALMRSEERYRLVAEQTGQLVYEYDLSTGWISWAGAVERLTGFTLDEFAGVDIRGWEELIHPEDRALALMVLDQARTEGTHYQVEYRFRRKDGSYVLVEDHGVFLFDDGQVPARMLGAMNDVTERRRAEDALKASEERFRLLYERSPVPYQSLDERGHILEVNHSWLKLLGFPREEVIGRWIGEFLAPSHTGVLSKEFPRFLEAGEIRGLEMEFRRKDGTQVIVSVDGRIGLTRRGSFKQTHCILHDITARKKVEEETRNLNLRLEERVRERTAQLEATVHELEAFSYTVSHDLRAPLRAVSGFSQIVLEDYADRLPAEARRYLRLTHAGVRRMGRLIEELLDFSRLGRQPLRRRKVSPEDVVRQCLSDLRESLEGRSVEIVLEPLPPCRADPALLRQVFLNLLDNALKYTRTRDPAVIKVGSARRAGETVFFVQDNGVGFDMQWADKLFGVFQRLHRQEEYEGAGVGLAIVQRIIHRHGGRIWAEAAEGQGATFSFILGETEES